MVKINEAPKGPMATLLLIGPDVTRQSVISDSKCLRVRIVNLVMG